VSGSGTTYNVAVTGMTSTGTVVPTVAANKAIDLAGNNNAASTSTDNTVTYDVTPPSVTLDQAGGQADPTNGSTINYTVIFSEPVTGFATGDVTVGGTSGGAKTGTVSGSGTTYNVAVTGMTSTGTVVPTVAANKAIDLAGNNNAASTSTDNTVTYDISLPTVTNVTSSLANGSYTVGQVVPVQVQFSESVDVTGTPQLQLETGATDRQANYAAGSGSNTLVFNYTVQASDTSADLNYLATTSLTLNGGSIEDAATNDATLTLPGLAAAGALATNKNIVIDTASPAVTLTAPAAGSSTSNAMVTFSGAAGNVTGDANPVTANICTGTQASCGSASSTLVQTLTATRSGAAWTVTESSSEALVPGTYTAQAAQADTAGNTGSSGVRTFTVTGGFATITMTQTAGSGHKDVFSGTSTVKTNGTLFVRVYAGAGVGAVPIATYSSALSGSASPFTYSITTGNNDLSPAGGQFTAQAYEVSNTGAISNAVTVTFNSA
jgi:hypothetical protein